MLPHPVYTGSLEHPDVFCQASDPVGLKWQPPVDPSDKHHGGANPSRRGGRTYPAASSHESFGCASNTPGAGGSFLERQRN